jgi:hypothetical protein
MQYNGGKEMTSGSFTSTADMDFYVDVDAHGTELVIVSDNVTTRHQVRLGRHLLLLLLLLLVLLSSAFWGCSLSNCGTFSVR